ncbi:MAG: hypothetical protein KDK72_09015 [Chlamydiia bacterium]|nr:hypothetical protein [Chlamydiia bacterium]
MFKLLLLLVVPMIVVAQEDQIQQAYELAQAGDQEKARAIYENLLLQEKEPWKQAILRYDIATTYLQEGQLSEALQTYDSIRLGANPYPLLLKRIEENLAVARWREALRMIEAYQEQTELSEDAVNKAIFLIRQVFQNVRAANDADCLLRKIEGSEACMPPDDLEMLRQSAQKRLAEILLDRRRQRIEEVSPQDALIYLIFGVGRQSAELRAIGRVPDTGLRHDYINREVVEAETWLPLWEAERKVVHDPAIDRAFIEFNSAIALMKEEDIISAEKKLEAVSDILEELLKQAFNNDPVPEILEKLLSAYRIALAEKIIQRGTIAALEQQQIRFSDLLREITKRPQEVRLENAAALLKQSMVELNQIDPILSRLLLIAAQQEVELLKWEYLDKQQEPTAETVLERAIALQRDALDAARLAKDRSGKGERKELLRLQNQVALTADVFETAAYREQQRAFNKADAFSCQYLPWAEALPLFSQGKDMVIFAREELSEEIEKLPRAIAHQEQAIIHWQRALAKLKEPRTGEPCRQQKQGGEEGKQEQQPQEGSEQQQKPKATPHDEVLRLLQQMEQDDRQQKKSSQPVKQGDKPW